MAKTLKTLTTPHKVLSPTLSVLQESVMENEEATSNIISPSNRPIISLPLGLALLLISLFCVSTLLSCCLNWYKLRTLLRSSVDDTDGRDVPIDITDHLPEEAAGATDHAEVFYASIYASRASKDRNHQIHIYLLRFFFFF